MGEQVQVDLTALTTFANTLGKDADDNLDSAISYGTNIWALSQILYNESAASGFAECSSFADYHQIVSTSVRQFLTDAVQGISSIAAGAEVCAINYAGTDQLNAANLTKLADAVQGGKAGFQTIDFIIHGNATVSTGDVNDAFNPKQGQGLWSQGGTAGGTAAPPTGMTKDELDKANKDFNALVAKDKQIYVGGKEADPNATAVQGGQATTIGTGKYTISIPGDQSTLTVGKDDMIKPVTG